MEQDNNITYTQALKELESIVAKMQQEDCDIDNLSRLTARALELLKLCKQKLFQTDEEVKKLLQEL